MAVALANYLLLYKKQSDFNLCASYVYFFEWHGRYRFIRFILKPYHPRVGYWKAPQYSRYKADLLHNNVYNLWYPYEHKTRYQSNMSKASAPGNRGPVTCRYLSKLKLNNISSIGRPAYCQAKLNLMTNEIRIVYFSTGIRNRKCCVRFHQYCINMY